MNSLRNTNFLFRWTLSSILSILPILLWAQPYDEGKLHWGIKAGGNFFYFQKEDLVQSLFPNYAKNPNCLHVDRHRLGGTLGLYFYYRQPRDLFAFQNEISYSFKLQGDPTKDYDLMYATVNNTIKSDLFFQMNYEFFNITSTVKFYPISDYRQALIKQGFSVIGGAQFSVATADDRINLGSENHDPVSLLNLRTDYRNALRGLSNLSLIGGIGWEGDDEVPLNIELKYFLGMKDLIEVRAVNLGIAETLIRARFIEFSIGYTFPMGK